MPAFEALYWPINPAASPWEKRPIKHAGRAPDIVLAEVRERLAGLLGID
jgi:mRNA interferase MazF